MESFIEVQITTATEKEADTIAQALVERRLAACAQVSGPIRSSYIWNDNFETSQEWLCVTKTKQSLFDQLVIAVKKIHSYECPQIIALPIVLGNKEYLDWIEKICGERI
ncbi:MAG: divalent-cation tolerance protein CutA [Thermoguttaceae bacterium]